MTDEPTLAPGLSIADRRERILALIGRDRRVEVTDLAAGLAVAEETVRRDLRTLEAQGHLTRVHGGAVAKASYIDSLPHISGAEPDSHPLTALALERVPAAGSIFLDAGRACEALAAALPDSPDLQVVTNSVPVALAASRHEHVTVYNLGGRVSRDGEESGQWARELIVDLSFDRAFFVVPGLDGSDASAARTHSSHAAALKRAALARATESVLLVDGGEPAGLIGYARAADFHAILSVCPLPDSLVSPLTQAGVTVAVAEGSHA
ncbi:MULTISPECIES: DeoR/GlpR family DNA-binding transcription regulator [unclassified Pseudactinotalea]|uniref:DeoR/GlpR family DNA-binding transcription regulator n=1 Tax=unclassified Pseudactinotalea TaxID=2649176 RepID=UPI00128C5336|nr:MULTISPECIES: DeoR/GlpR family DNA-binding transcription regulator [unclassified Pseudactinotalea]MPV51307.1 DeoR family transcriptional regulator [Pseudactinotalea sp. HY160]QGH69987.1 DeoR family transcriptional regulator [Pseudactinotalea sp. HY158]